MTETPLDRAHAAMQAAPDDDTLRLRFFERLADAELCLLLEDEPKGDDISPRVFDTGEGRYLLAFDREDRLAAFAGGPAPYAALSGRGLAALVAGHDIGLGLNLDTAPSATLLPPQALAWLTETLGTGPEETAATAEAFAPPADLPHRLLESLDTKLATAAGLATAAHLAQVTYRGGRRTHLLAFTGARPGAEPALARAVSEALIFSGLDAGELDVTFLAEDDPALARLAGRSLRFDLPQPEPTGPRPPGMDPSRPPKLR